MIILIFTALLISLSSISTFAEEIHIYTWEDYFDLNMVKQFEQETGHSVRFTYYDDETMRDSLINSDKGQSFNIILLDNLMLNHHSKNHKMFAFNEQNIPNLTHQNSQWREACSPFGVPHAKGTIGIAYRESVNKAPINSWKDIFYPAQEHFGRVSMINDDVDTLAVALLLNGDDPFTDDKEKVKQAYAHLKSQQAYLSTYEYFLTYGSTYKTQSNISLALAYSGDLASMIKSTKQDDWRYVVPKEGTLFWVDCLAVPRKILATEGTLAFINFFSRPDVALFSAENTGYSTTNKSALLNASEEYLSDTSLFTSDAVKARSQSYKTISPAGRALRSRINSTLKLLDN